LITMVIAGRNGAALDPSVYPLTMPALVPLPTFGILVALLPAWLAPQPPALASVDLAASFEVAA